MTSSHEFYSASGSVESPGNYSSITGNRDQARLSSACAARIGVVAPSEMLDSLRLLAERAESDRETTRIDYLVSLQPSNTSFFSCWMTHLTPRSHANEIKCHDVNIRLGIPGFLALLLPVLALS